MTGDTPLGCAVTGDTRSDCVVTGDFVAAMVASAEACAEACGLAAVEVRLRTGERAERAEGIDDYYRLYTQPVRVRTVPHSLKCASPVPSRTVPRLRPCALRAPGSARRPPRLSQERGARSPASQTPQPARGARALRLSGVVWCGGCEAWSSGTQRRYRGHVWNSKFPRTHRHTLEPARTVEYTRSGALPYGGRRDVSVCWRPLFESVTFI